MTVAVAMTIAAPAGAYDRDGQSGYGTGRPSYPGRPGYNQPAPPVSYPQSPFTYGPPPSVYIPPAGPFLMPPPPPQPVYPEGWSQQSPQHRGPHPQSGRSWGNDERRDWQDRQQRGTVDDYRWRGDQDAQRWGSRDR